MSDTEGGQYHEQAAASLASSVAGISAEAEERRVVQFLIDAEIPENHEVNAVKGAFLAKGCGWNTNPDAHPTNTVDPLVSVSRRDKSVLDREDGKLSWSNFISNLRDYPSKTYWLLFLCSIGALVQGFDEAAVNGGECELERPSAD
jgi:hypothetical protein